jgi:16S rRNA processing protein RimM
MLITDCFRLGTVTGTHGVQGGMHVAVDSDHPAQYAGLKAVWLEADGVLREYPVLSFALQGDKGILRLEGIGTPEIAAALKGRGLYLPLASLPPPGDGRFYVHEAFGFEVEDRLLGRVGVLTGVVDSPGQTLAQIRSGGREILLPLVPAFVERIDREAKVLYVNMPEGLAGLNG